MAVKNIFLPNLGGRQFLISDIHGCARTLKALLGKIDFRANDQLIFLGDFINKGPDSKGVLDILIDLKKHSKNIFIIRGNNEDVLLKTLKKSEERIVKLANRYDIVSLFNFEGRRIELKKRYRKFFKKTFHYIETDSFLAVHAGFDFKSEDPFCDTYSMLWIRNFKSKKKAQQNKPVIHGHKITSFKGIIKAVKKEKLDIPIDNGCVLGSKNEKFGRLICLDFTHKEIIWQKNIDQEIYSML